MEKNRKVQNKKVSAFFIQAGAILALLASVYGISLLNKVSSEDLMRNMIMTVIGIAAICFLIMKTCLNHSFDYDNESNSQRFFTLFFLCVVLMAACTFLPPSGWPFLAIFVTLALFSNGIIGVLCGSVLLMAAVFLSGQGIHIFMLYFLSGIIAVACFQNLDSKFTVGIPTCISMMVLMVCETANVVIYENEHLSADLFVIPVVNVIIETLLLIAVLRFFSSNVIFKYRISYLELNDPECELLADFKNNAKKEYYQSMHTAYFCDRIARKLSLDKDAAKAAGYYHRIGCILEEGNTYEAVENMLKNYGFPPKVHVILKEFLDKKTAITSKETAVLIFSEAIIGTILEAQRQSTESILDYDKIVETVFRKKIESGMMNQCEISMKEIILMKRIFIDEKLYYELLQ
ncbi:hypothetical protein LJC58_00150 [Lachnospiraceae bacterium OttesenSCG-928-D06]|nr:hypothetical protein [Lachnospiraceae bacterium OttesenSCG-928-D06]